MNPNCKIFAVELKKESYIWREGRSVIQGIGAGFIPKVPNTQIIDEIIKVEDEEALLWTTACKVEGLYLE